MKNTGAGADLKRAVGRYAVDSYLKSGMKVGIGTGSTAIHAIRRLAELLKPGELTNIVAVATSFQSLVAAQKLGIPIRDLNSPEIDSRLDVTIDGADEIDPDKRLIKGGGAAHLLEKIVAYSSDHLVVVADESKLVPHLGAGFPVPLEVIPQARLSVERKVRDTFGCRPELRIATRKDGPVITDQGNLVLDLYFEESFDPVEMEAALNRIPGVVENGIFRHTDTTVLVAHTSEEGEISVVER